MEKKLIKNQNQFKTLVNDEGRVCTSCGEFKTWENYRNSNKTSINVKKQSQCKQCTLEKRKALPRTKEYSSAKERNKRLKKDNPILYKARITRSRLLSRVSQDIKATTPTVDELISWFTNQPLICYYSGVPLQLFKLHIDHKTPVARGGTNALSNLCLASHHMNTAKGKMTEKEFRQLLKVISKWEDKGDSLLRRLKQGHFG